MSFRAGGGVSGGQAPSTIIPNTGNAAQNTLLLTNAINQPGCKVIGFNGGVYPIVAGDPGLKAALNDREGLTLQGCAGDTLPYQSAPAVGTILQAASGAGVLVDWAAVAANQSLRGNSIQDIAFDCNSIATIGLQLTSHYGGYWRNVGIYNATTTGLNLATVNLVGVDDLQANLFENLTIRVAAAAAAKGMILNGLTGFGNVSLNTFINTFVLSQNGTGIQLGYSDSNRFYSTLINRTGTALGIDFLGSNSANDNATANVFYDVDAVGGVTSRGIGLANPALNNCVFFSTANSNVVPTIETGSVLQWATTRGVQFSNYRTEVFLCDDFLAGALATSGSIGDLNWGTAGGTTTVFGNAVGHPGIVRLDTTATSGTIERLGMGPNGTDPFASQETWDITWILRLNTNDANTQLRAGFANNLSTDPPNDGVYFEKLAADVSWFGVTRAGGVQNRTAAIAPTSTNWVVLRLRRVDASTVGFSINGAAEVTATLTIPATGVQPWVQIVNSAAASKTVDVDYFEMRITSLARTGV